MTAATSFGAWVGVSSHSCLSACNETSSWCHPPRPLACHAGGPNRRLVSEASTQRHGLSRHPDVFRSRLVGGPSPLGLSSAGLPALPAASCCLHAAPLGYAGAHLSSSHFLTHTALAHAPWETPTARRSRKCRAAFATDLSAVASAVTAALWAQPPSWAAALGVNAFVFSLGSPVLRSGLSASGMASSFLLGVAAWKGFGPPGYALVCLYFLLGTAVTKLRLQQKEAEGIAEQQRGRRGPGSVVGSAASAVACAAGVALGVGGAEAVPLWQLGYVASFCTKLSDTTASEVGKAYGKTTYLITSLALVPRGTEGAVSLEGTLAGLAAAAALAGVAVAAGMVDVAGAVVAVVASQVANVFESWLGATSQGKAGQEWLSNDLVNVLNISVGTTLAILLRIALLGRE